MATFLKISISSDLSSVELSDTNRTLFFSSQLEMINESTSVLSPGCGVRVPVFSSNIADHILLHVRRRAGSQSFPVCSFFVNLLKKGTQPVSLLFITQTSSSTLTNDHLDDTSKLCPRRNAARYNSFRTERERGLNSPLRLCSRKLHNKTYIQRRFVPTLPEEVLNKFCSLH